MFFRVVVLGGEVFLVISCFIFYHDRAEMHIAIENQIFRFLKKPPKNWFEYWPGNLCSNFFLPFFLPLTLFHLIIFLRFLMYNCSFQAIFSFTHSLFPKLNYQRLLKKSRDFLWPKEIFARVNFGMSNFSFDSFSFISKLVSECFRLENTGS